MLTLSLVQTLLTLAAEVPSIYSTIQGDLAAVSAGGMTMDQFTSKWTDMQTLYTAGKAKWTAAAQQPSA